MAEYDFSTLNSSDLEELVCDLLNLEQPETSTVKYKTFKDGKDKGIDFLFSTSTNPYEHVGQVKHYYRTGYDGLYNVLKNTEVKNVNNLKPSKYIVATSVDLSVANTESIKGLFGDFIKDLNDIYGKKDLNRLIKEHEEILNNHYKLWLSDFTILKKILGSELEFRSSHFEEYEFKRRLRIYIKTSIFEEARQALNKNKFIIITGEPGVGKTTLAEMLVYEYIANDYKLSYIFDDIKEAEKVLLPDDSKQIIYFDDFLGSNKVEINRAKGSETALRSILRRVRNMENKIIVFTTRSFLLKTAVEESENLRRFNIIANASTFKLEEYSFDLKKQLLDNHIEDTEIDEDLKNVLRDIEIQKFIIHHSSYTPRSIEFITTKEIVGGKNKEQFKEFIYKTFDYPDEIWIHAYSEQITEDERLLLNTLISFGETATIHELEEAFLNRVQYEIETNNKTKEMHAFKKALSRLEGGFIIIKNSNEVKFINPSLIDFLVKYLQQDKDEVLRIANSVKFVSQLTKRLFLMTNADKVKMPKELQERIITDYKSFINKNSIDYDLIRLALVIHKFVDSKDKEDILYEIIEDIDDWESLSEDYSIGNHFKDFIISFNENPKFSPIINERIEEIVYEIFRAESDLKRAIDLLEELTLKFNLNFNNIQTFRLESHLDDLFSEHISNEAEWLLEWITDEYEAVEKINEMKELEERINSLGLIYEINMDEFNYDWHEIAWQNELARIMAKDD